MPIKRGVKPVAQNRKARHDYFIEETLECGIELFGTEVKSLRMGGCNLKDSYAQVKNGELFLIGMHISPLTSASTHNTHDPVRTRKLLLHEREISRLIGKVERAGYALVPIDLHFLRGRIKLEIGLAKGKKQHDKRADQLEKESKREAQRAVKERMR